MRLRNLGKNEVIYRKIIVWGIIMILFGSGVTIGVSPVASLDSQLNAYLPILTQYYVSPGFWWHPTPGTSWQIQFSGTPDLSLDVQMYDLDLFDTPTDAISQLHNQGRKVVCYFSAGSWENWRPDANLFPSEILGNDLEGWAGEKWLDIRRLDILESIMGARLDQAVQKGCDGVDPDNVDGYTNNPGFPLTYQDQIAYNTWIANQTHARNLAVGLKNDLDQINDLGSSFDWALNEQCFQYNECSLLAPFIQNGKPVFGIEYQGKPAVFCPQADAMNFDTVKKHLNLDAWRIACR
jgi:hypothetical protein